MYVPLILAVSFIVIHLGSKYLSLPGKFQQWFISFAAGLGLAYVFTYLWPHVAEAQRTVEQEVQWLSGSLLNYALYLLALGGLILFFSIYRLVADAEEGEDSNKANSASSALFWAHIGFFAVYSLTIGILVNYRTGFNAAFFTFLIAFGLHFVMIDWDLRDHHESAYDHYGRYILSASIFAGYLIGLWANFPEYFAGIFEAFITGTMLLNVIRSELPSEKNGSLGGFLTGSISAAAFFVFL